MCSFYAAIIPVLFVVVKAVLDTACVTVGVCLFLYL